MKKTKACTKCDLEVIDFIPTESQFEAVTVALEKGSKSLAAAELKYFAQCADSEAQAWIAHLLSCTGPWSYAADQHVLVKVDEAFALVAKPLHFTDYTHCSECKEHDDTLRRRTRDTLRREDLGNAGWDPITFSSSGGVGYFFPSLARIALLPALWRDHDWYGAQLVSHLSRGGVTNDFLAWCLPHQCEAVAVFLEHLLATRMKELARYDLVDEVTTAIAAWRDGST
jgi:hypothetical protein